MVMVLLGNNDFGEYQLFHIISSAIRYITPVYCSKVLLCAAITLSKTPPRHF